MGGSNSRARVRLETDARSAKAAILGLAVPRYRAMREAIEVPEPIRIILDSIVMTPDRKLIFIKSSKVAGTSMKGMLEQYAKGVTDPAGRPGRVLHSNAHWRDYLDALEHRPGITYAFCRNPFDRLLSGFRDFLLARRNPYRRRHDPHFARHGYSPDRPPSQNLDVFLDYIEESFAANELYADRHWRKQVHNLAIGHVDYDLVGRVENLEADMTQVLEMAGIDPRDLVPMLRSKLNNTDAAARVEMTPAQRSRVETLYADDFEAFGY